MHRAHMDDATAPGLVPVRLEPVAMVLRKERRRPRERDPFGLARDSWRVLRGPFRGGFAYPLLRRRHEVPPDEARPIERLAADEHDPRGRIRLHAHGFARP